MNTQEIKAVEEAAEAQANKLRLYTSKYDFSRGFIAGAQFLDELRMPSEPDKELLEALKQIANAPLPFNEFEYGVFVHEARRIACEAISNYESK